MAQFFFIIIFLFCGNAFCDLRSDIFQYAPKEDIPTLLKILQDQHWNQNPKYWEMLLRHPKAKGQISLYEKYIRTLDGNPDDLEAYKLILDFADEKDFDRYFNIIQDNRGPNLKTLKEVLKTPPYRKNPEIITMAVKLRPHSHQDFIRDLPQIHAGESWRNILEKKLVGALGQDFVTSHIKLPDYIVSRHQISAVETLLTEGKATTADIKEALRLGEDPKSYQYFQAVIKRNGPKNHRNFYWESYLDTHIDALEATLETDHLFFYPKLVSKILDGRLEDSISIIKKTDAFLKMLSNQKILEHDIEKIIERLIALPHSELIPRIEFAMEVIKAQKGMIYSPLIELALEISNNEALHQKAFLLGQKYLSAMDRKDLTKYLSTWQAQAIVTEEGLESFEKIIKKGNMGDLTYSDVLSGRYIHREQAKELIHHYAHPEDVSWALEYLEKNSVIDRPKGLEILKKILNTSSLQREKGLIELAIAKKYNTTPFSIFEMAAEKLSKEDLKFFMEEVMLKKVLTYKQDALMVDLILRDPFTASYEPFLKGFLGSKGHQGVIKKEQEIIKLAQKNFSPEELTQLKDQLKKNFEEAKDIVHEFNRLDSIHSVLEHSKLQHSKELLRNLLNGEHLSDLKLKSFKDALKFSHSDDLLKLLQILRKNEITNLKGRTFLALLMGKKSQRNLSLINAAMAINLPDDKRTLEALFFIGEEAPTEMAADLVSYLNGVVLNDQQLKDIKKGLKSWELKDMKQSFLHTLDKKLPSVPIKSVSKEIAQITGNYKEIVEELKSWSLNETQLKTKIEEAIILARSDVKFRSWLLDQVLDRDPSKKWRFTKTNHLLQQRSALVLLRTYEGTSEVSPLMQQLEKVAEAHYGQNYRNKPHFRFEEENPLVRQALKHFAGGELAPISSCDQIKQIIGDSQIQLEGVISP